MITYRIRKYPLKVKLNLSLFYGFFRMIFDWKTDPSCEYNWRWKTSPPPPLLSCSRTDVRWESPMKWKYNHIWIDWFLLGVRPHKQDPMGCHLPQSCCNSSIHNRNRKKNGIRTTFGRVSSQRPELLIFHFKTSWCLHPVSPSSLKLLVVPSELPTLTFLWFISNLDISHLVLTINGSLSFGHLSTKVGNTGCWYHVMILPFWETATLCNPKFCSMFGRQLWKRFKGRLLPK